MKRTVKRTTLSRDKRLVRIETETEYDLEELQKLLIQKRSSLSRLYAQRAQIDADILNFQKEITDLEAASQEAEIGTA